MDLANSKNTKEAIMKENGKTVCQTDKEKLNMKMEIFMKENFKKEKDMDMDTIAQENIFMRENGEME